MSNDVPDPLCTVTRTDAVYHSICWGISLAFASIVEGTHKSVQLLPCCSTIAPLLLAVMLRALNRCALFLLTSDPADCGRRYGPAGSWCWIVDDAPGFRLGFFYTPLLGGVMVSAGFLLGVYRSGKVRGGLLLFASCV